MCEKKRCCAEFENVGETCICSNCIINTMRNNADRCVLNPVNPAVYMFY